MINIFLYILRSNVPLFVQIHLILNIHSTINNPLSHDLEILCYAVNNGKQQLSVNKF